MEEQLRQIKWILAGLLVCSIAALTWFTPLGLALVAAAWWVYRWTEPLVFVVLVFLAFGFVALALWWLVRPVIRTLHHRLNTLLHREV